MTEEVSMLLSKAEDHITHAVRLLVMVAGEDAGKRLALQIVEDRFEIEARRNDTSPLIPGIVRH